jgi:hypothetical protein
VAAGREPGAEGEPAAPAATEPEATGRPKQAPTIRLPVGTRRIHVGGPMLRDQVTSARFGSRVLDVEPVGDGVEVDLGDDPGPGTLTVDLGDAGIAAFALEFDNEEHGDGRGNGRALAAVSAGNDPWWPA